jgi:ATP-binding cassette subfamily B (MDR/TAP) protein 1
MDSGTPKDVDDSLVLPDEKPTSDIVDKKGKKKKKGKDDEEEKPIMVPFFSMFRYADQKDKAAMIAGSIAAVLNGAILPAFSVLIGLLMDAFRPEKFADPNYSLSTEINKIALYFVYIGIGAFILSYLETGMWMLAGERQIRRVRENYLRAVLRQEVGWFDISKPSEISTRITTDSSQMQEAIGEKVGGFLHHIATFIAGFVVGFVKGWQLTLVILAVSPLLMIAGGFMAKTLASMTKRGLEAYANAGGVAEESISNIRTVTTFSGDSKEGARYTVSLQEALKIGIKKGIATGLGMGAIMFVMFGTYALAFWYGSTLISNKVTNSVSGNPWTGGDVVTVFFSVIMGAFAVGQAGPNMQAFANGRAAAFKIFTIVDRQSKIDPYDPNGAKPDSVHGDIEFRDVHFRYPSRPEVPILNGLSIKVPKGQTVALVGESGCGKSTTIALLERFYDALEGEVLLDGTDIKSLNIKWLRQNLGLVSQEPQLFATTIAENIRYGKEDATLEEIIEASKAANAHDFISKLPAAYDTMVGEKGVQMSGGQKQRIAIARAIIKNPAVLLLDEATSALDTENERLVQQALDKMMVGRTTLVIAHRLATVRHADRIIVINQGRVAEEGNHDELMALSGLYTNLVQRQTMDQNKEGGAANTEQQAEKAKDIAAASSSKAAEITSLKISVAGADIEQGSTELPKDGQYPVSLRRIYALNRPEAGWMAWGFLSACGNGAVMPIFALIYSEILKTFQQTDPNKVSDGANFLSVMFLVLACGAGFFNFWQIMGFTMIGEYLTFRLRDLSFRSILRQDIGFFDDPKNSTGILTTKLATDATLVQGLTTQRVSILVQNCATLIAGLVIAFVAGWKLSLVVLSCMPLVAISGKVQMSFLKGFSADSKGAYEKAGEVATEAVGGIRTIASFTNEEKIIQVYSSRLEGPTRLGIKRAHVSGIGFGVSQFIMFASNALAFWYGGKLVDDREWKAKPEDIAFYCTGAPDMAQCQKIWDTVEGFGQMMKIFFAIIMSAMGLGQTASFAPDAAKASIAASGIFELIDRKSPIDPTIEGGSEPEVRGDIEFRDIKFRYPARPTVPIFDGMNLRIPAGKTVALVGDSGGGKSTVISLLERFYDPLEGSVFVDGVDIKSINLKYWRSQIGLVSQEPTLFSTTIAKNIAYGDDKATMEQIEAAARQANCHDFISKLPEGYNTKLGDKYTQLSGGQKQRVAIARAILLNPKIMLLDEATSALDSESEKLVQSALETVMKGRTTIVIAHRLSTIKDADVIAVMKGGRVVELGSHDELLAMEGVYTNLVKRQL